MPKVKLNVGGQVMEGETMTVTKASEPWSYYTLDDGTVLKMKFVVTDVLKLPGTDPVTGLPQFIVRSSNVVSVEATTPKDEQH